MSFFKTGEYNNEVVKKHLFNGEKDYYDICHRVSNVLGFDYSTIPNFFDFIIPSFPILQHIYPGSTTLPFACYTFNVHDSHLDIMTKSMLAGFLTKCGGGIGFNFSEVRERGARVGIDGVTDGITPFLKMFESTVLSTQQSKGRRGSFTAYLDVNHPDIEEFINLKNKIGDKNLRLESPISHIGVKLSDEFMRAATYKIKKENKDGLSEEEVKRLEKENRKFQLKSRYDGSVVKTIDAGDLLQKIVLQRMATSEPYIMFSDTIDRAARKIGYLNSNESISCSNLCTETLMKTEDYTSNKDLIGICAIANFCVYNVKKSLYLSNDSFLVTLAKKTIEFFELIYKYAENQLDKVKNKMTIECFDILKYSILTHKHIAIGCVGYQDTVNNFNIDESFIKDSLQLFFKNINKIGRRSFKLTTAIAPTATTSRIFTLSKSLEGHKLQRYKSTGQDKVTDIEVLSLKKPFESNVKSGSNIDYLNLVSEFTPYVDQAISCNLYYKKPKVDSSEFTATVIKDHIQAYKLGLKTLYYLSVEDDESDNNDKICYISNPSCEACSG